MCDTHAHMPAMHADTHHTLLMTSTSLASSTSPPMRNPVTCSRTRARAHSRERCCQSTPSAAHSAAASHAARCPAPLLLLPSAHQLARRLAVLVRVVLNEDSHVNVKRACARAQARRHGRRCSFLSSWNASASGTHAVHSMQAHRQRRTRRLWRAVQLLEQLARDAALDAHAWPVAQCSERAVRVFV